MNEVRKKKVQPYPIPISIQGQEGRIVKLARTGFLVQTKVHLKVGDPVKETFILPVFKSVIQFRGVVVKTYDRFQGDLGEKDANVKLAEIGFRELGPGNMENIEHFLVKIGAS